MSKVPTFVKLNDGNYYKNPTLGRNNWFICFDDDDPPELVIKMKMFEDGLTPKRIIDRIGLEAEVVSDITEYAGRCFEEDSLRMEEAVAVFLKISEPPSTEWLRNHDGIEENSRTEGVYYF